MPRSIPASAFRASGNPARKSGKKRDIPWYAPKHPRVGIPRQRQPGEEIWRLRDPVTGRVQSCELRDDSHGVRPIPGVKTPRIT